MEKQKRIFDPDKIYTKHVRTSKWGGITICGRWDAEDLSKFEIGVGFCSPEDPNFNKKLGRMIATGRLKAQRCRGYAHVEVPSVDSDSVWEYMEKAISALAKRGYEKVDHCTPRWFMDFLQVSIANEDFSKEVIE